MTRRQRLAALLRRLSGWLDPLAPQASVPAPEPTEEVRKGTIAEVRAIQEERLREIAFLIEHVRDHDPDSGLCWFGSDQLRIIVRLLEHELCLRERKLAQLLQAV